MKCPDCGTELVMLNNAVECGMQLLGFFRCEKCWVTHNVFFSNPYFSEKQDDPLRLTSCNSPSGYRHTYFKCSKPGNDQFTLIAKRGKYAKREFIEMLGYTIISEPDENVELPGWRLYEIV